MALINYITQIQIDFGAVQLLASECERIGIRRPLVVTDAGVRAAGVLDRVTAHLGGRDFVMFDGTPSNPTERAMRAAVAMYLENRCDGIVAVGGGSPIDLAKGVAVCATHEGPLKSFAAIEGGAARITAATAPVIAVPTTAGTGSEVGRGAVLILDDGRKVGVLSPFLVPRVALCDPELTLGPAALPHRRHRHGRHRALHGDLHGAGLQPAGRRHRARRPAPRLEAHRDGHVDARRPRGAR